MEIKSTEDVKVKLKGPQTPGKYELFFTLNHRPLPRRQDSGPKTSLYCLSYLTNILAEIKFN